MPTISHSGTTCTNEKEAVIHIIPNNKCVIHFFVKVDDMDTRKCKKTYMFGSQTARILFGSSRGTSLKTISPLFT